MTRAAPLQYSLPGEAATARLGDALAVHCPRAPGSPLVLYLQGTLGAGKTTLARALIAGLGHEGPVRSPSYTLVEPYEAGGLKVLHADLYRLQGADDWRSLGIGDELDADTLLLIEWPERAAEALPPADLAVELAIEGAGRTAKVSPGTEPGRRWAAAAAAVLQDMQNSSR